jgi:hypothetical protein
MSAWSELRNSIRKIILMEDKIDRLAQGVDRVASEVMDHEKRLIRIETLIEVAQNRGPGGNPAPRRIE